MSAILSAHRLAKSPSPCLVAYLYRGHRIRTKIWISPLEIEQNRKPEPCPRALGSSDVLLHHECYKCARGQVYPIDCSYKRRIFDLLLVSSTPSSAIELGAVVPRDATVRSPRSGDPGNVSEPSSRPNLLPDSHLGQVVR